MRENEIGGRSEPQIPLDVSTESNAYDLPPDSLVGPPRGHRDLQRQLPIRCSKALEGWSHVRLGGTAKGGERETDSVCRVASSSPLPSTPEPGRGSTPLPSDWVDTPVMVSSTAVEQYFGLLMLACARR